MLWRVKVSLGKASPALVRHGTVSSGLARWVVGMERYGTVRRWSGQEWFVGARFGVFCIGLDRKGETWRGTELSRGADWCGRAGTVLARNGLARRGAELSRCKARLAAA